MEEDPRKLQQKKWEAWKNQRNYYIKRGENNLTTNSNSELIKELIGKLDHEIRPQDQGALSKDIKLEK